MAAGQSWGRFPKTSQKIQTLFWNNNLPDFDQIPGTVLPYGKGRSYGDVCLNDGGVLLETSYLDHFLEFNSETGLLKAEAGVTFEKILETFVPMGWFLPVTPGTKIVTLGGAVANDVHGKNHHKAGTFGAHVEAFELLRSSGERLVCSRAQNSELFCATIGGLGLTGLLLWVSFKLKKIPGPYLQAESVKFENLEEFESLTRASDKDYEYSVAWVDCLTRGKEMGRGHFIRGNFAEMPGEKQPRSRRGARVPCDMPGFLLNPYTVKTFNHFYYHRQKQKKVSTKNHYEPFFYPLDSIQDWNRMYGAAGFFQYQCLVPKEGSLSVMITLFEKISSSGQASFLTVLKAFGGIKSPGMLSFPKPGLTLALDFPNRGEKTLSLMRELDKIVRAAGGAVNPSKDARMAPEDFKIFFPRWKEFSEYIDPKFSSSFWRRVTKD